MIKTKTFKCCLIALLLSLSSFTAFGFLGIKISHDNDVFFKQNPGIDTFSIEYENEVAITSGQPFKNPVWFPATNYLRINAGRSGSSDVADWFLARSKTAVIYTRSAGGNKPGELNFAVHVHIIINGTSYSAYIGQGSDSSSHNNWWIGSTGDFYGYPTMMVTSDGKYIISARDGESFKFDVWANPILQIDWMKNVDDNKSLKDISIPGTHDTCTSNLSKTLIAPALGLTQCQDFSVGAQLIMGVRSLDIRVKSNGGIYHRSYTCNSTLDQVVSECLDFLKKYPTETILFTVKNEGDTEDNPTVQNLLRSVISAKGEDYFWTKDQIPTLGQVRGKIVIINRMYPFQSDDPGIKINWPDNTAGEFTTGTQNTFFIQDKFKGCDVYEKIEYITSSLSRKDRADYPSFIFSSRAAQGPITRPRDLAYTINPALEMYLAKHSGLWNTGWVIMDFPNQCLINSIIQHNLSTAWTFVIGKNDDGVTFDETAEVTDGVGNSYTIANRSYTEEEMQGNTVLIEKMYDTAFTTIQVTVTSATSRKTETVKIRVFNDHFERDPSTPVSWFPVNGPIMDDKVIIGIGNIDTF